MPRNPLSAFVRASALHIGAAAATASLREELVEHHGLEAPDIDRAYAIARVTPGTNLLALYAILGHRLAGWPLALKAVAVGCVVPAAVAVAIAYAYSHSSHPALSALMSGARAGGVAVFIGSAIRLVTPQLRSRPARSAALTLGVLFVGWALPDTVFTVLLVSALVGALALRAS